MLKIILGHSKSGKSSYIYDRMKGDAANGTRSYLIVPEQQTVQCEQSVLNLLPPSAQLTTEVLNFSRLANLVFRHYGGLSYNYADKGSKTLIMWKNLRELAPLLHEYGSVASSNRCLSFSSELLSAVSELKAYRISPEKLESAALKLEENSLLKKKLLDLSLICSAYNAMLSESYSDSADDLTKLAEKLADHDFFRGAKVYIDSFTSFTAQEYEVIRHIVRSAAEVSVSLTLDTVSTTQIHYESTADTALRLVNIAKKLSVDYDILHLEESEDISSPLSVIRKGFWQPDVKDVALDNASDSVRIISAADPYEEAEAVANTVRRLIMDGMRCRDIAIIARDASQYRGIIDVALEKAEIPYFFSQATDILSKPLVKFLLSALRIKLYNWRHQDIMSFLRSGLGGFDPRSVDLFECYCTVWHLSGAKRFAEEFTMNPGGFSGFMDDAAKELLREVNALRSALVAMLEPLFARLDSASSADGMCRALYIFMEDAKISELLSASANSDYAEGRRREAAETLQLYNLTVKALENIAISLGDSDCTPGELIDALKIIFENTAVNTIPTAKDQVTVGSASMLRADGVKCAIIIGLNESEFPQNVKETGIFSNNDKKILDDLGVSLSPDTSIKASDELFFVYRAMSLPTEKLFLLFHENKSDGSKASPSTAITRIQAIFRELKPISYASLPSYERLLSPEIIIEKLTADGESSFGKAFRLYADHVEYLKKRVTLSEIPIDNRYCKLPCDGSDTPLTLSQTLIDKYVGCPFEYMCCNMLGLKDFSRASFDYLSFGTYIHYIFECFLRRAAEDGVIGSLPDQAYVTKLINECADEYISVAFAGGEADSKRLGYRFERMKRLANLVAVSIMKEFADSRFRPRFFELKFGNPNGRSLALDPLLISKIDNKPLLLTGKIDRVDLCELEGGDVLVRVIDYKSGEKTFSPDKLESGEDIQLPLYLFALCDNEKTAFSSIVGNTGSLTAAGAMYVSSKIPTFDVTEGLNVINKAESSISRSGFLLHDRNALVQMSQSLNPLYICGIKEIEVKDKATGRGKAKKEDTVIQKKLIGQALTPPEQMENMKKMLYNTVKDIGTRIIRGDMDCAPSFSGGVCRCERCSMRSVCRAYPLFIK